MMPIKLDLISRSLRPEYEALRENLKQIRSQCLDDSTPFLKTLQTSANVTQPRKLLLTQSHDLNSNVLSYWPKTQNCSKGSVNSGTEVVMNSSLCKPNCEERLIQDENEKGSAFDTKMRIEEESRRDFGEKLLAILSSEEFELYRQRFKVQRDLESVLSALTSNAALDADLSEEDKKIKQDLEKLFIDVLQSPECQLYKSIVKEKSPKFKRTCNEIETRNSERRDKITASGKTPLAPKGLAKLCEPFCPRAPASEWKDHVCTSVPKKRSGSFEVISPIIDCLLLLALPQNISMEFF